MPSYSTTRAIRLLATSSFVVSDFNGVIADDEDLQEQAIAAILSREGAVLDHAGYVELCLGRSDEECARSFVAHFGLARETDELVRDKLAYYRELRETVGWRVFAGIAELLRALAAAGRECWLVTASEPADVTGLLVAHGLAEVFPEERRFTTVPSDRRDATYTAILDRTRHAPNAGVVLDDSPFNLLAARRLGLATIGVATTYPAADFDAGAVVATPGDLWAAFARVGMDRTN
jgi:phosphoglycolate phosphatase